MKKAKFLPYIIAVAVFYILSYSYFSPLLEGKVIKGSDDLAFITQFQAISEYQKKYNESPKWTDAVFSGMPTIFISSYNPGDLISIFKGYILNAFGVYPAVPLMIMLIGFFFLLRVLKVDPWLSIVGAVGYGFTTFFFILIPAGHFTQTYAFAFIAPLIASVIFAYQYNRWLGAALVAIFASFEFSSGHPQMAYYSIMILGVFVIIYFINAIKENTWKRFLITSCILSVSGVLAIGSHMNQLYPQYEYQKHSIRSASELTTNTDDKSNAPEESVKSGSGLDYDYATSWSSGIDETFSILIPNLKGGGGSDYWGDQPFTSGPMYIGAVILFLFVLSLFLLTGPIKWWLLVLTVLSIFLSWGHNSYLYDFFFYYVPLFNKFRNPIWALVIAMFTMPLGSALALQSIIKKDFISEKIKKQLLYSVVIVGGICLLFWVAPGMAGDFEKSYKGQNGELIPEHVVNAQQYAQQTGKPYNQQLINAFVQVQDDLVQKRKEALKNDAIRSFLLIIVSFLIIYLFITKKGFKKEYFIFLIGAVILFDLWGINQRFINKDYFLRKKREKKEIIQPFVANNYILQTEKDNRNLRVLDLTQPLDQDSHTPYFHPAIGGYNAAKLRRYQELIDYRLGREFNTLRSNIQKYDSMLAISPVINMLNAKYIIYNNDSPPLRNTHALGVGWFVNNIIWANNADEEIKALKNLDPTEAVVINSRFKDGISFNPGSSIPEKGSITVVSYKMDHIVYDVLTVGNRLAVFSEIYYPNWHAFVDGKEVPVFQCNYVLRGIEIPDGKHKVEFRFIASDYVLGSTVAYISSIIILGLLIGLVGVYIKEKILIKKRTKVAS